MPKSIAKKEEPKPKVPGEALEGKAKWQADRLAKNEENQEHQDAWGATPEDEAKARGKE